MKYLEIWLKIEKILEKLFHFSFFLFFLFCFILASSFFIKFRKMSEKKEEMIENKKNFCLHSNFYQIKKKEANFYIFLIR